MHIDSSGNVGIGTNNPSAYNAQLASFKDGGSFAYLGHNNTGGTFPKVSALSFGSNAVSHTHTTNGGTVALTGSAQIAAIQSASSNAVTDMAFYTTSGGSVAEKMRIDSSGNVLIGTTSSSGSSVKLEAHDATNPIIQVKDTTSNIICGIQAGNSEAVIRCPQDSPLVFNIGASETERMRIGSDGTLQTRSSDGLAPSIGSGCVSIAGRSGSSTAGILRLIKTGDDGQIVDFFRTGNTAVGNISVTPTATSYNTSSDYRLKENVDYEFNALDRVAQLKPARFNFIADADTTVDGFLAHEVQDIVPEAITGEKDAVREEEYEVTPAVLDDDGNVVTEAEMGIREVPDYQGIDQSKLVPLLTKAIQEQQELINNLTARIEQLEN